MAKDKTIVDADVIEIVTHTPDPTATPASPSQPEESNPDLSSQSASPEPTGQATDADVSKPESALAVLPQSAECPACHTAIPMGVNFCPRCGASVGSQNQLSFPVQLPPGFVPPVDAPGRMSVGMIPMLALLCGVLGFMLVPAMLGVILGLTALGQIRRLGGLESDRKQAMWGISLGLFWAVVFIMLGSWYGWRSHQQNVAQQMAEQQVTVNKKVADNEANAITILKGVARAERLVKLIRLKDPQRTGMGQYMTVQELAEVGTSFFSRDLASGKISGYRLTIRDAGESGYLAIAEPEHYNQTGRRIFTINASGMVRGLDNGGKAIAEISDAMPVLSDEKSAFDGMNDSIAAEALAHAKRLADDGKYALCQQILEEIATKYATTSAAQELSAVKKTVDPFIVEAQAQRKHQKATDAFAAGDEKLGMSLLKEIVDSYPTYSKISAVSDLLGQHDTSRAQQMDKDAKALFDKAEALERVEKPTEALDVYTQLEKNYPNTEWGKRVAELRPALLKSTKEKNAENLFATIRDQSVTTDFRNIVSVIQQLQRNYADTEYVGNNKESINALYLKAQTELARTLAVEEMKNKKDADALARLEEVCVNNPDARARFRDLFLTLYPRVGRRRMDEGDLRTAYRLYRSYLDLEPEPNELDPKMFNKLQFTLARTEFGQGNFNNAMQLLIGCRKEFENTADYNDLFGCVEVALGNYLDAVSYFDRAINDKPKVGNYYARRGYTQVLLALRAEREALMAYAGLWNQELSKSFKLASAVEEMDNQQIIGKDTQNPQSTVQVMLTQPGTTPDNSSSPTPLPSSTTPQNPSSAAAPADPLAQVFLTQIPVTASGTEPDMQIRYDAVVAQQLFSQLLELMDAMSNSNFSSRLNAMNQKAQAQAKANQQNNSNQQNQSQNNMPLPSPRKLSRTRAMRTSVDFANDLSSLNQRILDVNSRRQRSVQAMRRMSQYFTNGNLDLEKAMDLNADRSPQLMEIRKLAIQHEQKVAQAVPLIVAYLAVEYDTLERVASMAADVLQAQRTNTNMLEDPIAKLDLYFTRYFDRHDFDNGIQILRESGAIKVPLERYTIVPVAASVSGKSSATPASATPTVKTGTSSGSNSP